MLLDFVHSAVVGDVQARQTAVFDGHSTDDFPGWRKRDAQLRAKLRRTSSITQTKTSSITQTRDEVHLNFALTKATSFLHSTDPSVLRPSEDQPNI